MFKNDLLIKALRGESVDRPPVWMMRQAGRYLPDFMKLKHKYDFFTRCQTPELATEITVMPVDQVGVDAAILFSDILVVPQAMDIGFEMKKGVGPWLEDPIRDPKRVENIQLPDVKERLHYVFDAIKMTKAELNNEVPLIGFAGSPWTLFCYIVEGQGSKNFAEAKEFCFKYPQAADNLLQKLTDTTIVYLQEKIKAGVDVVQIFDSWGGLLSPTDYQTFSWTYIQQIIDALKEEAPVIAFAKGCWFALDQMAGSGAAALSVDWTCSPRNARKFTDRKVTLQGNLDPSRLLSKPADIKKMTCQMIDEFGKDNYIANLGHGILPNIPVDNAKAFVEAVKAY